jgi:hypothetical protein
VFGTGFSGNINNIFRRYTGKTAITLCDGIEGEHSWRGTPKEFQSGIIDKGTIIDRKSVFAFGTEDWRATSSFYILKNAGIFKLCIWRSIEINGITISRSNSNCKKCVNNYISWRRVEIRQVG